MKTIHIGLKISNEDFCAFIEDLVKAKDMFIVRHRKRENLWVFLDQ